MKAGRKVANRPRRKSRTQRSTRAVRKWAQAQGYEVSERGRSQHILDAYQKRTATHDRAGLGTESSQNYRDSVTCPQVLNDLLLGFGILPSPIVCRRPWPDS